MNLVPSLLVNYQAFPGSPIIPSDDTIICYQFTNRGFLSQFVWNKFIFVLFSIEYLSERIKKTITFVLHTKRQEDVWYKKMNFPKNTETNVGTKNKEVIFNINNKKYSQRTYNRNNRHSWIKFKPELETGDQSTYWSHTHMAAISVQAKCCHCPIGSSSPWLRLMRGIRSDPPLTVVKDWDQGGTWRDGR